MTHFYHETTLTYIFSHATVSQLSDGLRFFAQINCPQRMNYIFYYRSIYSIGWHFWLKMSRQLLNELPLNLIQIFTTPSG